jgi:hypothetical protein
VKLSRDYDTRMMEIALEYSGLLFFELEMSRVNVRAENALVESLQRQATTAFQMKLFSEYLSLETKGLVSLVTLSKESEQYKRCKKAIKDNITASFLRSGSYQGVRVLNVYHLSNQRLSRQLQVRPVVPSPACPVMMAGSRAPSRALRRERCEGCFVPFPGRASIRCASMVCILATAVTIDIPLPLLPPLICPHRNPALVQVPVRHCLPSNGRRSE